MTRGYTGWFKDVINVCKMPATVLKIYVQAILSQCRFCKLKMLYKFKTFVSLLSGHASYVGTFYLFPFIFVPISLHPCVDCALEVS